jgi:hypothetical protein
MIDFYRTLSSGPVGLCIPALARIEDENVNDMGSAHGLDAASIHNWVNGTHDNMGPEGGNTTPSVTNPSTCQPVSGPDITNLTEPVTINVNPYTMSFSATTLPSSESPGNSDHNAITSSYLATTGWNFPAVSNIVSGIRTACSVAVFAVSGRFTIPRTSGLNVRSSITTNTIPMPSDMHTNGRTHPVSGCDFPKNANRAPGGGGDRTGTLPLPSRAKPVNFVAEVLPPLHMRAAYALSATGRTNCLTFPFSFDDYNATGSSARAMNHFLI